MLILIPDHCVAIYYVECEWKFRDLTRCFRASKHPSNSMSSTWASQFCDEQLILDCLQNEELLYARLLQQLACQLLKKPCIWEFFVHNVDFWLTLTCAFERHNCS